MRRVSLVVDLYQTNFYNAFMSLYVLEKKYKKEKKTTNNFEKSRTYKIMIILFCCVYSCISCESTYLYKVVTATSTQYYFYLQAFAFFRHIIYYIILCIWVWRRGESLYFFGILGIASFLFFYLFFLAFFFVYQKIIEWYIIDVWSVNFKQSAI